MILNSIINIVILITIMSLLKYEKVKERHHDKPQALLEERKFNKSSTLSNNSRLS